MYNIEPVGWTKREKVLVSLLGSCEKEIEMVSLFLKPWTAIASSKAVEIHNKTEVPLW